MGFVLNGVFAEWALCRMGFVLNEIYVEWGFLLSGGCLELGLC